MRRTIIFLTVILAFSFRGLGVWAGPCIHVDCEDNPCHECCQPCEHSMMCYSQCLYPCCLCGCGWDQWCYCYCENPEMPFCHGPLQETRCVEYRNPPGSETWTDKQWAGYLSVCLSGCDQDPNIPCGEWSIEPDMDLTTPGTYTISATQTIDGCRLDPEEFIVTIVELADIDFPDLADEIEQDTPGGFVKVNDDDDNKNGLPDFNESGVVADEDDLVPISLSVDDGVLGWSLSWSPPGAVRFWCESDKSGDPLVGGYHQDTGTPPGVVYMEGLSSTLIGGLNVTLTANDDTIACSDSITATVVECRIIWPKEPIPKSSVFADGLEASFVYADGCFRQSNQAVPSGELGEGERKRLWRVEGVVSPLTLLWELNGAGLLTDYSSPTPTHITPDSSDEGTLVLKAMYLDQEIARSEVLIYVFDRHLTRDEFNFKSPKNCCGVPHIRLADDTQVGDEDMPCMSSASHAAYGNRSSINLVRAWPNSEENLDWATAQTKSVSRGDVLNLLVRGAAGGSSRHSLHWQTVSFGSLACSADTFAGDSASGLFRAESAQAYYQYLWDRHHTPGPYYNPGWELFHGAANADAWMQEHAFISIYRRPGP